MHITVQHCSTGTDVQVLIAPHPGQGHDQDKLFYPMGGDSCGHHTRLS